MSRHITNILFSIRSHQGFVRYFSNAIWVLVEQVLRIFAGLLVGVWVARHLGPERFGLLSYIVAFVAMFGGFAKLGLDSIIVKSLVNNADERDLYLGTAFWLKLCGALITIVFFVVVLLCANHDVSVANQYILILGCGLVFQSFDVIDFYFQSRVLSKFVSLCRLIQLMISSLLKIYLVLTKSEILWFVIVGLIDQIVLALALVYAYSKQNLGQFYFNFDRKVARDLLVNARPLVLAGAMVSVYSAVDKIIIKEMLGVKAVGFYSVGYGLTTSLYFIPLLVAGSLFPAILNAKKQSIDLYNQRLSYLYKFLLFFGFAVCTFVCFFAPSIIDVLYGHHYQEAVQVLQISIWIFLVICFSSVFGKWILSERLQHLMPRFSFMALVTNIFSCFVLIPTWSIKGAAMAALASQVIPFIWFGLTNKEIKSQIKCAIQMRKVSF